MSPCLSCITLNGIFFRGLGVCVMNVFRTLTSFIVSMKLMSSHKVVSKKVNAPCNNFVVVYCDI